MNRLTEYKPRTNSMFPYVLKDDELRTELDSIHKLGQLEDLEEEIGMELKVYHKLMNMLYCSKPNILYVKDKNTIVQVGILEIDYCKKKIIFYKDSSYNDDYVYGFDQYGKTFALTKEELENGKTNNKRQSN